MPASESTQSRANPHFLGPSPKLPNQSPNPLSPFWHPLTEISHSSPWSPSLEVVNPTCSTTGRFLVVFDYRALTMEITYTRKFFKFSMIFVPSKTDGQKPYYKSSQTGRWLRLPHLEKSFFLENSVVIYPSSILKSKTIHTRQPLIYMYNNT